MNILGWCSRGDENVLYPGASGYVLVPLREGADFTLTAGRHGREATGAESGALGGESTVTLTPTPGVPGAVPGAAPGAAPSTVAAGQKSAEINFSADGNQLFTAWNAVTNLADLAGKVNVT
jgi:hypothetical protein